jgi:uncharacterized protein (DUF2147 family)
MNFFANYLDQGILSLLEIILSRVTNKWNLNIFDSCNFLTIPANILPSQPIDLSKNNIMYKAIAILCLSLFYFLPGKAQNSPDDVLGVWKNGEGTAMIKIVKAGSEYQGKIVWLKEPNDPQNGKPKVDNNNPEEANRTKPVLGLTNVWGFKFKEGEWIDGFIYDPKNGKTYDCIITMTDKSKLSVRGYIMGMTMFGRTDTWVRQVAKK